MDISNHIKQIKEGTHRWTRLFEVLGAVLLILFLGWAIYAYIESRKAPEPTIPSDDFKRVYTLEEKKDALQKMMENATNTGVTIDEREAMIQKMLDQADQGESGKSGGSATMLEPSAPTVSDAERAKILEQMKKGSQ